MEYNLLKNIRTVGILSIGTSRSFTDGQSKENLALTAQATAGEIDSTLAMIEQSVNSLSQITVTTITDFHKFQTSSSYVKECTDALKTAVQTFAENIILQCPIKYSYIDAKAD